MSNKDKKGEKTSESVTCLMCNTKLASCQLQIEHDFSMMHQIKLDQVKAGKHKHSCNLCKLRVGSLTEFATHLKSKKHLKFLEKMRQKWIKIPPKPRPIPVSFTYSLPGTSTVEQPSNKSKEQSPPQKIQPNMPSHKEGSVGIKLSSNTSNQKDPNQDFRFNFKDNPPPLFNQGRALYNQGGYQGNYNTYNHGAPYNNNNNHMQHGKYNNNNNQLYGQRYYNNDFWNQYGGPGRDYWGWNNQNAQNQNAYNYNSNWNQETGYYNDTTFYNNQFGQNSAVNDGNVARPNSSNDARPTTCSNYSKSQQRAPETKIKESSVSKGGKADNTATENSVKVGAENRMATAKNGKTDQRKEKSDRNKQPKMNPDTKKNPKKVDSKSGSDPSKSKSASVVSQEPIIASTSSKSSKAKNSDNVKSGKPPKDKVSLTSKVKMERTEKDNDSSSSKGSKTGNSDKGGKTGHLYFLSSDGESETTESPSGQRRKKAQTLPAKKNKKGDYNRTLIKQLVNNPCTRRQQLQLRRWMKNHNETRRRLILPRFNLPMAEDETRNCENSEAEMKIIVSEAFSELPEEVIVSLFEALTPGPSEQMGVNQSNQNSVEDLVDEGNVPWAEFLKSLSIADPFEEMDFEQQEHVQQVPLVDEGKDEQWKFLHPSYKGRVSVKQEIVEPQPGVVQIDDTSGSEWGNKSIQSATSHDEDIILEAILLPSKDMQEVPKKTEQPEKANTNPPTNPSDFPERGTLASDPKPVSSDKPNSQPEIPTNVPKSPANSLRGRASPASTTNFSCYQNAQKSYTPPTDFLNSNAELSQQDLANWLNENISSNVNNGSEPGGSGQAGSATPNSSSYSPQGLVNELLLLNNEEENLRDSKQKVEQMITQLYKLLEEWKFKRNEFIQEEQRLHTKRTKLLESLKGYMATRTTSEENPSRIHTDGLGEEVPSNITYLGTLDQTFDVLKKLSSTMDLNFSGPSVEPEPAANKKQKRQPKRKKSESADGAPKKKTKTSADSTPKKKGKNPSGANKKAPKKKKNKSSSDPQNAEDSEFTISPELMEQLMAGLPTTITSGILPEKSVTNATCKEKPNSRLPRFLGSDEEGDVTGKTFGPINIHKSAIIDLKVSKGHLYSCSSDATARCTNIKDSTKIVAFVDHKKTVSAIEFSVSEDGKEYIFTASHDGYLRCFNSETGECVNQTTVNDPIICMTKGWSKLYVGLHNGLIVPYSITNCKFLQPIMQSEASISKIVTCSEGAQRLLCVAAYDGSVTIRDSQNGLLIRCLDGKVRPPCCIHVESTVVYITTAEKTIRVHDLMTGALIRTVVCPSSATGLHVSREYVLSCGFDGFIRCYKKEDWTLHSLYYGAGRTMVICMAVSNNWVYTGNRHGIIEAFEVNYESVLPCRFQNCSLPFGRLIDLKHHVEVNHLKSLGPISRCLWRGCDNISLATVSKEEIKDHILSHCSKVNLQKDASGTS